MHAIWDFMGSLNIQDLFIFRKIIMIVNGLKMGGPPPPPPPKVFFSGRALDIVLDEEKEWICSERET